MKVGLSEWPPDCWVPVVYSRNFSGRGVECLAALLLNQLEGAPISLVWLFEHFGHLPGLGGLQDSLPSYLYHLLLAVNCRCNWQLLIECLNNSKDCWSVFTVITMNCYCLSGFWFLFCFLFWLSFYCWWLMLMLLIDWLWQCLVYLQSTVWTCILRSIVLLWHHSTFQNWLFNKPYMKSCLFVSFRESTLRSVLCSRLVW